MTKHTPIRKTVDTFAYRTEVCPDCSGFGDYEIPYGPGYVRRVCETCDGMAEIDSGCAECGTVTALNDENECERCHDKHELTLAEYRLKYCGKLPELNREMRTQWL